MNQEEFVLVNAKDLAYIFNQMGKNDCHRDYDKEEEIKDKYLCKENSVDYSSQIKELDDIGRINASLDLIKKSYSMLPKNKDTEDLLLQLKLSELGCELFLIAFKGDKGIIPKEEASEKIDIIQFKIYKMFGKIK